MYELDQIDWQILTHLQRNARASYRELGDLVRLSPPAVAERVRKMEDAGILRHYRATVDPKKVGYAVQCFIRLTVHSGRYGSAIATVREMPEVLECHRVTGDACLLLKVVAMSMEHLERVIDALVPFGQIVTSIVLSSPVPERPIPSMGAEG
ncbi:Lrp/AsnC family transcriptional regulator [Alicyclobacillus mali]|uniref:Lrp/AsnC family transcriptional regulator n=1 Tax=Alicyclobacillus mali (ex Roth et al. 2021) TaxID=1123961 RepID=A0ABS0F246_9BACL|nr:Lrp/AsnC family transcriptional regulator [Alicyclobacillus mali (ex Roth et al. 2021)]MBF8377351.1 Lrp/AsnC family transcriptional regulator [Alicyclobacillus mali (ex Roth et al. 2021)]